MHTFAVCLHRYGSSIATPEKVFLTQRMKTLTVEADVYITLGQK